tara:strand:+ start:1153 stop:2085 length:933 start_codon:yes stop_codon:yes gene_type:complete
MTEFQVAGITFALDRTPKLKQSRPVGAVYFVAEPDNEYDSNAVRIQIADGTDIGYVPKGAYQDVAKEIGEGVIIEYKYHDRQNGWNDEHKGNLKAITVGIESEDEFGDIIGARMLRCTSFLSYFDPYGGGQGLLKWAFNQGSTFDEYEKALNQCATDGTAMHDAIEKYFGNFLTLPCEVIPDGFENFVKKYEPEVDWMEERFRDNKLLVTGQPDWVGDVTYKGRRVRAVVDWKSSKKPSLKHKLQASIYACNINPMPEIAIICAFGGDNKQGYSVSILEHEEIKQNYIGCQYIRKAMDTIGVWIDESKFI